MNEINRYARRYHWLGEVVSSFVNEPHSSILSETREQALNLVTSESDPALTSITDIATQQKPSDIFADLKRLKSLNLPPYHLIGIRG